ncbi:ParB domain protein nuclease [Parvibaculum lavamentivorans DS-1]|uniref:ParB domain protein nuclease n=1 Tax=Parvibaculum lavamentivorans (strain DS-1 / DSM 13023 / NCIMB 13966) TaxID=402881 RepID=A7HPV5_PARL1|nr:ParB/RepB/Spo0J family partition protein [Parvibaculum lavamentivorans]ABS61938.1 ParB domain protein nuclease [Parvibaculum lavamentivorans DS-1]
MSENLMTIPLCQLKRATLNVRKTGRKADIAQLAASIEAHGLLENLVVRLVRVGSEEAEPLYEVVAGGRRYDALKLLAKQHKIAMDYPVPCRVLGETEIATYVEVSLAENIVRSPLHPADQFDAFAKLQKEGLTAEEIAARFGLPAKVVIQRLKLGAVSPRLMAAYRAEELTLDQLMAFAITDDHAAQEAFWFDTPHGHRSPQAIRRHLTSALVEGGDRRALFIGIDAYEAAGGTVIRDLFQPESEGYFADSKLLDRLVAEKLDTEAAKVRAEGWSWVEVMSETDYGALAKFGRVKAGEIALSEEDEARLVALSERYDELVAALEDQEDEAKSAELDKIVEEMEALEEQHLQWSDEDRKAVGVILSLTPDGELEVNAGLVRPEDRKREETDDEDGEPSRPAERREKGNGRPEGYSDTLLTDLSAHRTAALREMLAGNPKVALAALVYRLAKHLFFERYASPCLHLQPSFIDLGSFSKTVGESRAAATLLARHTQWCERLPEAEHLWSWLLETEQEVLLDLLAYCVALTLDAVHRKNESPGRRMIEARDLATALALDMTDWWQPTRAQFFDHLTKGQIIEVVGEATSASTAKYLTELKKPDMAQRAEELLRDKRWLPVPLRREAEEVKTEPVADVAAE